jgi:protein-tyrosine phosphatase
MAAALLNAKIHRAGDDARIVARSAGTWALENQPASGHALTVMAERGIDLSNHRGHTVTGQDIDEAAAIVVMTRSHRDALAAEFPASRRRLHLMSELKDRTFDIDDPYGGTLPEYQSTAKELESLIENGYAAIKAWAWDNSIESHPRKDPS